MSTQVPTFPNGDMSDSDFLARAPELHKLSLEVAALSELTPRTRQVRLGGADLARFAYSAGHDLMVLVDTTGGRIIRRRYTIRRFDPSAQLLDLNMIVHTDGPGARWARGLHVGDSVQAIGPRGKITLATDVHTHVFVGDDVAVPCMAAMVEALPAGSRAIVLAEVADAAEELPVSAPSDVELSWTWLHRGERAPEDPAGLLGAIEAAATRQGWPAEAAQAYIAGEAAAIKVWQAALIERGLAAERVTTKAYWGRGRANASHGEPIR